MRRWVTLALLALLSRAALGDEAPVAFDQALSRILARSTQIGVQQQQYLSLKASNVPSHLYMIPELSTDAKVQNASYPGAPVSQTAQTAEAQLNQNLFRFGADLKLSNAGYKDESQQRLLVSNTVLATEDQGVQALVEVIRRRLELEVDQRQIQVREDTLKIARERFDRGLLARQEVQKVEIDVENARSRYVEGQLLANDAEATLQDLLGSTDVETAWPWKDFFLHWKPGKFIQSNTLKIDERPDWTAAQYHLSAEEDRVSRDYRLILPSFDLNFTYGTYRYSYNMGIPNGPSWQTTISMTLPLFDRLTNLSNARSDVALQRQADIQREEVLRSATAQYAAAGKSLLQSVRSAAVREATLADARGLYQDSLRRFQNGRSDSNEVLIDQNRVLDSELLAISGWSEAHLALSRFCHQLGKRIADCIEIKR